ncbi:palmitoyltransferase ZDHHC9-like isoform X2 [Watersipora subatra]|uniref:palmitoyltransferase ZDHHC9-like isoform X2 n=1 Tax=Watersipora subatra TaxID=2589382 RepID=UPI00355C6301
MVRDPEKVVLSGKVRKWEVFPGRNRFCCDGRIMLSTQTGIFYFTLFLIIATSACFFAIDAHYLWRELNPSVPILAAVQCLFVAVVLCRTACGDPGVIPRANPAEAAALERKITNETNELINEAKRNNRTYTVPPRLREVTINGTQFKLKYCYTCKIFRPPRASHCSVCDNCVDRFDHHCPWVGNCVGRRNYKYFYLFLSSLTFYCLYLMGMSVTAIVLRSTAEGFSAAMAKGPLSPVVALVAFFSIWSVAGLAGFHTYLVCSNMTTNEDIKGTFKRNDDRKNPFSSGGCCQNFIEVICGPLPPSLIDRRGWVSEHDVPTLQADNGFGRTTASATVARNVAYSASNHNAAASASNDTMSENNTAATQVPKQQNSSETVHISNSNINTYKTFL